MTIRELIVTIGVIGLLVERIIRWIFRFIRPEKEIDKIAMDMVKLHQERGWDSTPLTYFYFYKRGLKEKTRSHKDFIEYLEHKERRINQTLKYMDERYAIIDEMEHILDDLEQKDKLPPELKELRDDVRIFYQKRKWYISIEESKIKDIASKIFRRLKK